MTLTEQLLQIDDDQRFIRFELEHVAAPVARERAIGLAGGSNSGLTQGINAQQRQNQNANLVATLTGSSLSNLADRIAVDPQGNALIFKGTDAEIERVKRVLAVIDVPNTLEPKSYFAGSSAAQIADIASQPRPG
jgi:type II secretory pathway component GspD/PulD (secretin)